MCNKVDSHIIRNIDVWVNINDSLYNSVRKSKQYTYTRRYFSETILSRTVLAVQTCKKRMRFSVKRRVHGRTLRRNVSKRYRLHSYGINIVVTLIRFVPVEICQIYQSSEE